VIEPYTPRTVWTAPGQDLAIGPILELLRPFGTAPVVVKDYVKSQKHYWHEACYIPNAADAPTVERVVRRFLELQGEDLNEGLVFREFIAFKPLTIHSQSGMPLTREFRLFYLDGQPLYRVEYWEEGDYRGDVPPENPFNEIARQVHSRFFTLDLAQRLDGEWMIIELGDGQVAGLPQRTNLRRFYEVLAARNPH
jgi:hypothetical protein